MLPRQQLAFGAEAGEDKQHGGEAFAALALDSSIEYGYHAINCLALLDFEYLLVVEVSHGAVVLPRKVCELDEVLGPLADGLEGDVPFRERIAPHVSS